MKKLLILLLLFCSIHAYTQAQSDQISHLENEILLLENSIIELRTEVDSLKLINIAAGIEALGWPGTKGEIVKHSAMVLSYDEEFEQARWVAHVISKEVAFGNTERTNDFRIDPLVSTGTAVEADYFVKWENDDNETQYKGFGYDRGHLAPSADFRWNQKALSESFFYSNMSPQVADFNRESWASLEAQIRQYAISNETNLLVVTGPVLDSSLKRIDEGVNHIAIPEYYYKVVLDTTNLKAIGFLMPNELCEKPLETYAKSIDEIEELTGLNFFSDYKNPAIEKLESEIDLSGWLQATEGDEYALNPKVLSKKQINTIQAYDYIDSGKNIEVCGTVVSTHKSKKGNVFVNLDKQFPNQVFTLTIWSRASENFSYPPNTELQSKRVCAYGKVTKGSKSLEMNIDSEKQITIISEEL